MTSYEKLEARFRQHSRLKDLQAISYWDEAVMMPSGSSEARGQALAELSSILQNLVSSKEVGDWIAETDNDASSLNSWQKANLAEIKRDYLITPAYRSSSIKSSWFQSCAVKTPGANFAARTTEGIPTPSARSHGPYS